MPTDLDPLETELRLQLLDYAGAGTAVAADLSAVKRGGDRRRRVRTANGTAGVLALTAVIAAGVLVPYEHSHAQRAVLVSDASPSATASTTASASPTADATADPDEAANYYRMGYVETRGADTLRFTYWAGHDRPSYSIDSAGHANTMPVYRERSAVADPSFLRDVTWDGLWSLPRTADGLRTYLVTHPGTEGGTVSSADTVFVECEVLTMSPGPTGLHLAALQVMDDLVGQDGITAADGVDADGRASRVFAERHADDAGYPAGQAEVFYLDSATGVLNERVETTAGAATDTVVMTYAYTADHS